MRERVRAVWGAVFGAEVDDASDFFDLGGYSLLAMRVISELESQLGVDVSLRTFFECPVFGDFADVVARLAEAQGASQTMRDDGHSERPPVSSRTRAM